MGNPIFAPNLRNKKNDAAKVPLSIGTREIESLLLNQEIQQSLSESSM
jgi:hypothetical protein